MEWLRSGTGRPRRRHLGRPGAAWRSGHRPRRAGMTPDSLSAAGGGQGMTPVGHRLAGAGRFRRRRVLWSRAAPSGRPRGDDPVSLSAAGWGQEATPVRDDARRCARARLFWRAVGWRNRGGGQQEGETSARSCQRHRGRFCRTRAVSTRWCRVGGEGGGGGGSSFNSHSKPGQTLPFNFRAHCPWHRQHPDERSE